MPTVITDKMDAQSIEQLLMQFKSDEQVDVFSTEMSAIEKAIVFGGLRITEVTVKLDANTFLFKLNNGTVIERAISQFFVLSTVDEQSLERFEIVGDGVLWPDLPGADISLKGLIQDELHDKYNLELA